MRTILGPAILAFTIARPVPESPAVAVDAAGHPVAATPAVPAKADPIPTLVGPDCDADPLTVGFTVPAYDLASHNKLLKITVVIVPKGHGEPTTVEAWEASSYPKGSLDVSAIQAGGPATVAVDGVPDGDFVGQVLYTFDA